MVMTLLSNIHLRLLFGFITLTALLIQTPPVTAFANSDSVTQVEAVKNITHNNVHLAVGVDSNLYIKNDDGTWSVTFDGFTRNGVSDVEHINGKFYATSFFEGAVSTDGKTWSTFALPLGEKFNPGRIMDDSQVFTDDIMSVNEIQDFLNDKNPNCRDGQTCLKDYREDTYDRAANAICGKYEGRDNETAAEIIHKAAKACGVSAEILMVMLQKEQSLITHTFPSQTRYNIAMGYACPDTAPCNTLYYGFYNQVYNAARQMVRYTNPEGTSQFFTWYPVSKTSTVRWHPNASCGGQNVYIENESTASFYYYTPYQPNTAAMVAFTGVGDSCSSYGNRNLWRLYNQWFNVNSDYETFITYGGQIFLAADDDGTIALSSNGSSWIREASTPVKKGETVTHVYFEDGRFVLGLDNGAGYASLNGKGWGPLSADEVKPAPVVEVLGEGGETSPDGEGDTESEETTEEETSNNEETTTEEEATESETITNVEPSNITHTVKPGDTVWALASRYGTTVNKIVDLNSLSRGGALIFVGQQLQISATVNDTATPVVNEEQNNNSGTETEDEDSENTEEKTEQDETSNTTHTVKPGDTVWALASRYNTTVKNIVELNSLTNNGALIFIGQTLKLDNTATETPESTTGDTNQSTATAHTVEPGDTLWGLSVRYGTTVSWIVANNKIVNADLIKPGLVLQLQ